jgi:hypothetical protein
MRIRQRSCRPAPDQRDMLPVALARWLRLRGDLIWIGCGSKIKDLLAEWLHYSPYDAGRLSSR